MYVDNASETGRCDAGLVAGGRGMFVISLLDAAGVISTASPLNLAIYYGLFGACGGIITYALIRRMRR